MADMTGQSAGSYPDIPLTARLQRRAREPLGVIDVRHPEHLGTRGAAWMGQRLEMLDRWKTRYGLAAAEAPAERAPVAAAHPFAMLPALPRAEAAPEAPLPAQLRVRRPGEARDARPAHSSAAKTADAIAKMADPVARDAPLPLRAPEITASRPGGSVTQVLRQSGGDADSPLPPSSVAGTRDQAAEVNSPQHSHGLESAGSLISRVSSVAPEPPPVISRVPGDAQTPALVLRRKVLEGSSPAARAVASPAASGLPLAQSRPATVLPQSGQLVQARAAGTSPSALILPSRMAAKAEALAPTSTPAATERPAGPTPIAPEIPAPRPPVGSAPIVWRRAEGESSSRSLAPPVSSAPSMQIMRAPSAANPAPSPAAMLSSIPASSAGADVGHLAGQVTRLIARQLTVERERRGLAP